MASKEKKEANGTGKSTNSMDGGASPLTLIFLIITGLAMLVIYTKFVPEGSSALLSVNKKQGSSRLKMRPTMLELETLYWRDSNGNTKEISIVDECVKRKSAEDLKRALGIPDEKLSKLIRELPVAFCRAVFQQWYNDGSTTSAGYPVNWSTLLKALDQVGLKEVAKKANAALLL